MFVNPSPMRNHADRRSGGFTLLEVLIAIVVLAIGLLGLAALQLRGLTDTGNAYLRSQATWLAYDVADRMRAAASIDYRIADVSTFEDLLGKENPDDKEQWADGVRRRLPAGIATVTCDANLRCDIRVCWEGRISTPSSCPIEGVADTMQGLQLGIQR